MRVAACRNTYCKNQTDYKHLYATNGFHASSFMMTQTLLHFPMSVAGCRNTYYKNQNKITNTFMQRGDSTFHLARRDWMCVTPMGKAAGGSSAIHWARHVMLSTENQIEIVHRCESRTNDMIIHGESNRDIEQMWRWCIPLICNTTRTRRSTMQHVKAYVYYTVYKTHMGRQPAHISVKCGTWRVERSRHIIDYRHRMQLKSDNHQIDGLSNKINQYQENCAPGAT